MTELCCFNQDFSAFRALSSPVVCWWFWKEPVCWWWDKDADLEMDGLMQMLNVTTTDSHSYVDSQALVEVCHRLTDVFLWQLFPDALQGDFQLITHLRLRLEFILLFNHGTPDVIIQRLQIWRVSMNPWQFACSQFCMTLGTLRNWGLSSLKEHIKKSHRGLLFIGPLCRYINTDTLSRLWVRPTIVYYNNAVI